MGVDRTPIFRIYLASLIANHPALASKIAHTMGIRTAACAIKLFWGFAKLIQATADAVRIAITANATFVSGWENQAAPSLIAPKGHGQRSTRRHGDSNGGQSNSEKLLHQLARISAMASAIKIQNHREQRIKIALNYFTDCLYSCQYSDSAAPLRG